MKREFAALFFYMLYMVAMIRPVMPIVEYYANHEYIVAVLCENRDKPAMACNGKCYLEKEMKKVSGTSSHESHSHENTPQIDFSKYPIAPIVINDYSLKEIRVLYMSNWNSCFGFPKTKTATVFRPPIFVV